MSSLLYLEEGDFKLKQYNNNVILCHEISGISLVLFYSPRCQYSNTIFPLYKTLPNHISGCNFGLVNVNSYRSIINLSHQSTTPIKHVPLIILYVDGFPHLYYTNNFNINTIRDWIISVSNSLKQQFMQSGSKKKHIPKILEGIGIPLSDECSYIEVSEYLN